VGTCVGKYTTWDYAERYIIERDARNIGRRVRRITRIKAKYVKEEGLDTMHNIDHDIDTTYVSMVCIQ
jgi:hypothetical protein